MVRSPPCSAKTTASPSLASMMPFTNTTSRGCTRMRRDTRPEVRGGTDPRDIFPCASRISDFRTPPPGEFAIRRYDSSVMKTEVEDWLTELPPLDGDEDDAPHGESDGADEIAPPVEDGESLDDAASDGLIVEDGLDLEQEETQNAEEAEAWEAD